MSSYGMIAPEAFANALTPFYQPSSAGDVEDWANYPAVADVQLSGNNITSNGNIQIVNSVGNTKIELIAGNSINLVPNSFSGSATGGIVISDGITQPPIAGLEVYEINPSTTSAILRVKAERPFLSISSGSNAFATQQIGLSVYCSANVSTITLPAAGTVPNGATYYVYVAAGQTVQFRKSTGTQIGSNVAPTTGQLIQVELFTPDQGATWALGTMTMTVA